MRGLARAVRHFVAWRASEQLFFTCCLVRARLQSIADRCASVPIFRILAGCLLGGVSVASAALLRNRDSCRVHRQGGPGRCSPYAVEIELFTPSDDRRHLTAILCHTLHFFPGRGPNPQPVDCPRLGCRWSRPCHRRLGVWRVFRGLLFRPHPCTACGSFLPERAL